MRVRKRALNITWREAWPIWLTFAVLSILGALGVWYFIPTGQIPRKALLRGGDVTVTVGELQPNLPMLFAYPAESNQTAEFFVERDSDGKITVAFASCRRCYQSGHYLRGSQILCKRCNEPMERLTRGQTPGPEKDCVQIPISFERSGDRLIVRANTVRDTFTHWYAQAAAPVGGGSSERPN